MAIVCGELVLRAKLMKSTRIFFHFILSSLNLNQYFAPSASVRLIRTLSLFAKWYSRFPKSPSLTSGNKQRNKVVSIQSGPINQSMIKKWRKKKWKSVRRFFWLQPLPGNPAACPTKQQTDKRRKKTTNETRIFLPGLRPTMTVTRIQQK